MSRVVSLNVWLSAPERTSTEGVLKCGNSTATTNHDLAKIHFQSRREELRELIIAEENAFKYNY